MGFLLGNQLEHQLGYLLVFQWEKLWELQWGRLLGCQWECQWGTQLGYQWEHQWEFLLGHQWEFLWGLQ